jgi:hypothetical protein
MKYKILFSRKFLPHDGHTKGESYQDPWSWKDGAV